MNNNITKIILIILAINLLITCTLAVALITTTNGIKEQQKVLAHKIDDIELYEQSDSGDNLAVLGGLLMSELEDKIDEITTDITDEMTASITAEIDDITAGITDEMTANIKQEIESVNESISKYDEDIQSISTSLEGLNDKMENVNDVMISIQDILDSIKRFLKIT